MNHDRKILRELAARYLACANSDRNHETILLHKSVMDRHPIRPIVLIGEIPWHEIISDDSLTVQCEDPFCRSMEFLLRVWLFQWEHFPADMVLPPYYPVHKIVSYAGIGLGSLHQDESEYSRVLIHKFEDQLNEESDLDKLHFDTVTYHEKESWECFSHTADLIGDILPVRLCGEAPGDYGLACKTWDDIVMLRGLDNLFFDLKDRPELIHKTVRKFTDIYLDRIRQMDELNLIDGDTYSIHCTSALTNDLHPDLTHVHPKDVWGRGLAQIFASVSPEMHDEFDTQYMVEAMKPFGLVYYGCCEPLHNKISILEKISNLRKISITPWANVDIAAECMGNRYVMSGKTNPAILAADHLDTEAAKAEIAHMLSATKRNGCPLEIVMKDISTVRGHVENLIEWEKIAMNAVQSV